MIKKWFFPLIIILSGITLSIYPDLVRLKRTPANHTFPLIHNSSNNAHQDYFYYLSFIRQGYDGNWLLTTRMTAEKFEPKLAYSFFAVLGHLSRITNLSAPWIYFLSRIILGIILLLVCVSIGGKLFKSASQKILLTVFLCFGTGFWYYKSGNIIQFFTFWTRFDPVLRTTFLPHHLFSTILGVLSLFHFSKSLETNKIKNVIIAGFLGLISGFVFYSTMINILGGIALAMLIKTLWYFISKTSLALSVFKRVTPSFAESDSAMEGKTSLLHHKYNRQVYPLKLQRKRALRGKDFINYIKVLNMNKLFFIYAALTSLSLIYLYFLSNSTFPWNSYQNLGWKFNYGTPLTEYILALGPVFILTLIGIPGLIKAKSGLAYLLLGWSFFPFIGFYLLNRLLPSYSNMIYLEATSYIPLSILAVYGIQNLYRLIPATSFALSVFKRVTRDRYPVDVTFNPAQQEGDERQALRGKDLINKAKVIPVKKFVTALLVIIVVYFVPPIVSSVNIELTKLPTNYYNVYLPNSLIDGFNWLNKNSPKESVVLAGNLLGTIIPAYTSNRVVFGHPVDTYLANEKSRDVLIFFAQKDLKKAAEILSRNNVSYIFFSLDTDKPDFGFLDKLGLISKFTNNDVNIYSFK